MRFGEVEPEEPPTPSPLYCRRLRREGEGTGVGTDGHQPRKPGRRLLRVLRLPRFARGGSATASGRWEVGRFRVCGGGGLECELFGVRAGASST